MLADYVARLEKKLDAAEVRAKDAEASARDAQTALTAAMLQRARDQKIAKNRRDNRPFTSEQELQSLRAELDSARRELSRHEASMSAMREEIAQSLHLEYEQKFHTARERLAQAFEKRLTAAQRQGFGNTNGAAKQTDPESSTFSPPSEPRAPSGSGAVEVGASVLSYLGISGLETGRAQRVWLITMLAAAFAGGLMLGWSMPSATIPVETAGANDLPPAAESVPAATLPAAKPTVSPAESARQTAVPRTTALETSLIATPAAAEPETSTPQVVAVPLRNEGASATPSDVPAVAAESTAMSESAAARLHEERIKAEERSTALAREIDELRFQLNRANNRAKAAESTLAAERKKAASRFDRTVTGNRQRSDQQPPQIEPTVQEQRYSGRDAGRQLPFPPLVPYLPAVE